MSCANPFLNIGGINDLYRPSKCRRMKTIPAVPEAKLKRRQAAPIFKPLSWTCRLLQSGQKPAHILSVDFFQDLGW